MIEVAVTGYKRNEIRMNIKTVSQQSVAAFFVLYYSECIHKSLARPTLHIFLYVGLAAGCSTVKYNILLCYDMHTSSYRCRDCCDTVLMFNLPAHI